MPHHLSLFVVFVLFVVNRDFRTPDGRRMNRGPVELRRGCVLLAPSRRSRVQAEGSIAKRALHEASAPDQHLHEVRWQGATDKLAIVR